MLPRIGLLTRALTAPSGGWVARDLSSKKKPTLLIDPETLSIPPEQLEALLNPPASVGPSVALSYKERQKVKAQIRKDMLDRNKKHAEQLAQRKEHRPKAPSVSSAMAADQSQGCGVSDDEDDQGVDPSVADLFGNDNDDRASLPSPKKRKMARFTADEDGPTEQSPSVSNRKKK